MKILSAAAKMPALCEPLEGAPFGGLIFGILADQFLDFSGDEGADGGPSLGGDNLGFPDCLSRKLQGDVLGGHELAC